VDTIEQAHRSLFPLLGAMSSGAFGLALIASGLSSSVVGTMAGQTIMQGFVGLKISDSITRVVTMAPGMLIIILGINPMLALVLSQVSLSFVLPAAIIPMLLITRRKDLMGVFANKPFVNMLGIIVTAAIVSMNAVLIYLTFTGKV
jgi:manganese transport protein